MSAAILRLGYKAVIRPSFFPRVIFTVGVGGGNQYEVILTFYFSLLFSRSDEGLATETQQKQVLMKWQHNF